MRISRPGPALAAAALCLSAGGTAAHAQAYCVGSISAALTYSDGQVMIKSSWRNEWTDICNLNTAWKGVEAQTCWGWFAQLNEAVQRGRIVVIHYLSLEPSGCATMPIYRESPPPEYVMATGDSSSSTLSAQKFPGSR